MRTLVCAALCGALVLFFGGPAASSALADFGFAPGASDFTITNQAGSAVTQAGSHPYEIVTQLKFSEAEGRPDDVKDISAAVPPGLVGSATAVPECDQADFAANISPPNNIYNTGYGCSDSTQVGVAAAQTASDASFSVPIYNLAPPRGLPAEFGFSITSVRVYLRPHLRSDSDYGVTLGSIDTHQALTIYGGKIVLWGVPAEAAHDPLRGACLEGVIASIEGSFQSNGLCPSDAKVPTAFLTMPTACTGPTTTTYSADSWQHPGAQLADGEPDFSDPNWVHEAILSHDALGNPIGLDGCDKLPFSPTTSAAPTTDSASTSSGLDFNLDINDPGLESATGLTQSAVKKTVVTLPEGMTVNPSIGEGLGVCTPAQIDRETLASQVGEGCPNSSKIGTLSLQTPLLAPSVEGAVFLAQQDDPATTTPGAENPFDSLIAFYIVLKNPELGILVKLPAKVEPDPKTGQLVVSTDNAPQLPFSHFHFHFREGARAPLISPPACGTYTTKAELTPWARPDEALISTSSFRVTRGVGGGPCPPGGVPPFHPGFQAGAINNNAGSHSPFYMRLMRADGEQDMTKFSAILPPGEIGSLVGVGKCPDAAIDVAKAKTGRQEIANPSCPANSLIGHTRAGAGVGDALTYVGGQLYLGGPYKGDPLSVISVTPAVAGPFDAGTVVVRLALTLNPKTAEVEVDGAASDPIPHILKGIVLKLRDLRVYVDRPNFLLNPTSCDESSAKARLFGSYLDVFDPADDVPVDLSARYQAANCLNLGFKPKLALNLKGGTKRGGHPGLLATYKPRPGDANVKGLVVRLPRSAFLDQAHIRTICTRVQFAAKACPKGAQYGFIKAWTPLLEEPLEGPVYLRSSNHKLPDLVFDLHGLVDVEVATRIDSANGGIRATIDSAPDAPLSKVVLHMQGGQKGLIVNSRDLCGAVSKADVEFVGHNGKESEIKPVMRADCGGKRNSSR